MWVAQNFCDMIPDKWKRRKGWMDGWMHEWMDGGIDGRMDGWTQGNEKFQLKVGIESKVTRLTFIKESKVYVPNLKHQWQWRQWSHLINKRHMKLKKQSNLPHAVRKIIHHKLANK